MRRGKRLNYADESMIKEVAELRKQGIKDFICSTIADGKRLKPVMKHTAQGISAYANSMYRKYGDVTMVEVGYFDDDLNWKTYCIYG